MIQFQRDNLEKAQNSSANRTAIGTDTEEQTLSEDPCQVKTAFKEADSQ